MPLSGHMVKNLARPKSPNLTMGPTLSSFFITRMFSGLMSLKPCAAKLEGVWSKCLGVGAAPVGHPLLVALLGGRDELQVEEQLVRCYALASNLQ